MAITAKDFCTCMDLQCALHPTNHDRGCDMCVKKNLDQKELPSCFFIKLGVEREQFKNDTTFAAFADAVMREQAKGETE